MENKTDKKCRICGCTLVVDENWYESYVKCYRYLCHKCSNVAVKKWQQANPEKVRAANVANGARYKANNKDRDPYDGTEKRCGWCREALSRIRVMWTTAPTNLDGLHSQCNDCQAISSIKKGAKKRGQILNLPENFTGKHLRELKQRQGNRCYVCNKLENGEKLHLDHNHTTGKLRGYACGPCNTEILAGLDALFLLDPTIIDHSTIKRILCDAPAEYLYC